LLAIRQNLQNKSSVRGVKVLVGDIPLRSVEGTPRGLAALVDRAGREDVRQYQRVLVVIEVDTNKAAPEPHANPRVRLRRGDWCRVDLLVWNADKLFHYRRPPARQLGHGRDGDFKVAIRDQLSRVVVVRIV